MSPSGADTRTNAERQLVDSATARHVEASMSVIGRAMAASSPSPPRVLVLSEMEGVHEPNGTSCAESVVESAVETPARVAADDDDTARDNVAHVAAVGPVEKSRAHE